jgi:hypothetical protein
MEGIELLSQLDGVEVGGIDLEFSLEVFEHLPSKETADALCRIAAQGLGSTEIAKALGIGRASV